MRRTLAVREARAGARRVDRRNTAHRKRPQAVERTVIAYHLPTRPAWTCVVCGDDYPCATRRAQLREDFRTAPVQFALFMSVYFMNATADLPGVPPDELHARFFWFRNS
jgi:hypothetical protein